MDFEKLQSAIAQMGDALESGAQTKPPMGQPKQPGQMMWDAGVYYFADGFTYETTKPVVQWIIEKTYYQIVSVQKN